MTTKVKSSRQRTKSEIGRHTESAVESLAVNRLPIRRFTIEEYEQLVDLGFFGEDERIELIDGILTPMMAINPPHARCLTLLMNQFYIKLGVQYEIRPQSPIRLTGGSSQPEPDLV